MRKLFVPLVLASYSTAFAQLSCLDTFKPANLPLARESRLVERNRSQTPTVEKTQLESLAARLSEVEAQKPLLRSNKIKGKDFEKLYMSVQKEILVLLESSGVKAKSVAQFDYNGLPIPPMFKGASREVQEDLVLTSSGNVEVGYAQILPNIEVLADASGTWANRLAYKLNQRGIRVVLTPGAVDDVGGASYSAFGKFIRLPLGDVLSGGITFQTQHELKHMFRDLELEKGKQTIFDIEVRGDGLTAVLKGTPYEGGFSIDELRAYPSGAYTAATLADHAPRADVPFIIKSANKGWVVTDAKRHSSAVIEIKRSPEFTANTIKQSYESAEQFATGLDPIFSKPIAWINDFNSVKLLPFLDESLIVMPQNPAFKMSIDLPEADGLPHKVTLSINGVDLIYNISADYSPSIKQALELAKNQTIPVPESTQNLVIDIQSKAQKIVSQLSDFLNAYKSLNSSLRSAVEAKDFAKAKNTLLQINHLVKKYEHLGLAL